MGEAPSATMPPLPLLLLLLSFPFSSASPLLLVVGEVTSTSARILYEHVGTSTPPFEAIHASPRQPPPPPLSLTATVEAAGEEAQTHTLTAVSTPRVLVLSGLTPCTAYVVRFGGGGEATLSTFGDEVTFSTFGDACGSHFTVAVQSCDRFVDDGDAGAWMMPTEPIPVSAPPCGVHATVMLGDQIYADTLFHALVRDYNATTQGVVSFDDVVARYRALYRYMWHHPAKRHAMRCGAHLTAPDDHDIVNNARSEAVAGSTAPPCEGITPASTTLDRQRVVYFAARAAYMEYQHQLNADVDPTAVGCGVEAAPTAWHFHTMAGVGVAVLDTRLDRVFTGEWMSGAQLDAVGSQMGAWAADASVHTIVVASGTPLLVVDSLAARVAHRFENESYPTMEANVGALVSLLDTLRRGGDKVQLLIGGDLHLYGHTTLCHTPSGWCADQVVTSGVSNASHSLNAAHLFLFETYTQQLSTPAAGDYVATYTSPGYLYNNFVVLEVVPPGTGWGAANALPLFPPKTTPLKVHPKEGPPLQWPWHSLPSGGLRWAVVTRPLPSTWLQVAHELHYRPGLGLLLLFAVLCAAAYAVVGVCGALRRSLSRPRPKQD